MTTRTSTFSQGLSPSIRPPTVFRPGSSARCWVLVLFLAGGWVGLDWAQQPSEQTPPSEARHEHATIKQFVTRHCSSCHDGDVKKAGLDLDALSSEDVAAHPEVWE